MPLNPDVEKLLAALPPESELSQHTPEIARLRLVENAPIVKGGDDLIDIHNFEIDGPNGPIPMRCYIPRGYLTDTQPLPPVAIHFHGGGFVTGSIDLYDANTRDLAARANCAVVAVGYRLAPEHPFPEGLHDCYAATEWVAKHGRTIGVDPDRIAIGGSSAGATLATSVCMMARDQGGPKLEFQFLVYPSTTHTHDFPSVEENGEGYWLTKAKLAWGKGHYFKSEADKARPYAAPLLEENHADLPPALVMTAEYDPLRDEGELYAARLAEAGVQVRLSRYYGMIHGFFIFRSKVSVGEDALNEVACAIASALGVAPNIPAPRKA